MSKLFTKFANVVSAAAGSPLALIRIEHLTGVTLPGIGEPGILEECLVRQRIEEGDQVLSLLC